MKKFIITILFIIMGCFMFTACDETVDRIEPVVNDTSRFQYIGQDPVNANCNNEAVGEIIQYYVDNKTNIIYIVMVNRWGKYYNQASIFRIRGQVEESCNWINRCHRDGERAVIVEIKITEVKVEE